MPSKKRKYLTREEVDKIPRFTERGKKILSLLDQYITDVQASTENQGQDRQQQHL